MENKSAEIAEFTVLLAKEKHTFDSVFDDKKRTALAKFQVYEFEVDGTECRFIYFTSSSKRSNPLWLDFINDQLPIGQKISFQDSSKSANGILLLKSKGRVLAASFGRSAASYLDRYAFETDFGIITAMNMCGNKEIRQTKSSSNAITQTHIDRSVTRPSDAFTFGLTEAEHLRYLSAHIKGRTNVTLQGKNSLTIKLLGKQKLNWQLLVAQCTDFVINYGLKDYVRQFPHYLNLRPASKEDTEKLDEELIKALKARDFAKVLVCIPEFIADDEFGFTYSNKPKKENVYYSYLDSSQLDDELALDRVTTSSLKARRIYAYSPKDDRVLEDTHWTVYECLVFEQKLEKKYFVLGAGVWSEVDADFYQAITHFITHTLREDPHEAAYGGIDISDNKAKKNKESIFNERVCEIRPTNVLFDRAKLRVATATKNKEFCDILDLQDDGMMRIINCKPYKDASSVNYLFAQSLFYCEAFLSDPTFLAEIRDHISKSRSPKKKDYLTYIPAEIERNNGSKFRLCLWLLYDHKEKAPSKTDLPLMAQHALKQMHERLTRVFKIREIVLRFVPVKTTRYKTSKKLPKKKAA